MSKIGNTPISIPQGVSVKSENGRVIVEGPKGTLERELPKGILVEVKDGEALLSAEKESDRLNALHGTYRAIIANMVKGVADGWSKVLELVGTGYRAEGQGKKLILTVGYSHPVELEMPEGVSFNVEKTTITVEGMDKESVGQTAAKIRAVRPPEPYKGKGIKYQNEYIRRKAGKAAKGAEA